MLVGHSFSGMIVTEAGLHPDVSALVRAARARMQGDYGIGQDISRCRRLPIVFDGDEGRLSEDAFLRDFAGDLPEAKAKVLYAVQQPFQRFCSPTECGLALEAEFHAVSTEDRTINPDLERFMAAHSAKTIDEGRHLSLISHPDEITG